MIEKIDYLKYLSYDNGKGLLLNNNDKEVLDKYQINYQSCSNIKSLVVYINEYLEDNYYDELEDLEYVLEHLEETYYYNEVNK